MTERKIIRRKTKSKIKIGEKFGRWIVLEDRKAVNGKAHFKCKCRCGKIKDIDSYELRTGHTKSCGCLSKELRITHGMSETPEYKTWLSMIRRCTNQGDAGYINYGGRGITVCTEWLYSFETFFKDMEERPGGLTIERINNDLGYFKENCCWASRAKQARNTRVPKNNKTGINGIHWAKSCQRYCVRIRACSKRYHVGLFKNLKDAKIARIAAEQKYWR